MKMYAETAKIEAPEARPSRPSATLTPLDADTVMTLIHNRNRMTPITGPKAKRLSQSTSRTPEMYRDAAVSPFSSVETRASSAKVVARSEEHTSGLQSREKHV